MDLPEDALLVQFNILAKGVMTKISANYYCYRRDVIVFFGAPIIVIGKLWELIVENNDDCGQNCCIGGESDCVGAQEDK